MLITRLNLQLSFLTIFVPLTVTKINGESYDDVKHCPEYEKKFLPLNLGKGLDSLTYELSKEDVFSIKYSECQTTPDKKFLVPDGSRFKIPTWNPKRPKYKVKSQVFPKWINYLFKPLTMETRQMGTPSTSRNFNSDFQVMKRKFTDGKIIVRVQLTKPKYELHRNAFNHTEKFKAMTTKVSDHLANGDFKTASYYSDLLIEKFGTNRIETTIVGGILVVEYVIDRLELSKGYNYSLLDVAKFEFADRFNFNSNFSELSRLTWEDVVDFRKIVEDIRVISHGGDEKYVNESNGEKWVNSVDDHPAVIMRKGGNRENMMNLAPSFDYPPKLRDAMQNLFRSSIEKYYQYNIHIGCVDVTADNFALGANLDDHSCNVNITEYFNFGGVYQICDETPNDNNNFCSKFRQKNMLTQDYSCPANFEKVLISNNTIQKTINDNQTHNCVWNYEQHQCVPNVPTVNITHVSFWCANNSTTRNANDTSGAKFGGLYTSVSLNPVTGNKSCPDAYQAHKIDIDIHVCVGFGFENKTLDIAFGGFYSRKNFNPYTKPWESKYHFVCPRGFSRNTANIYDFNRGYKDGIWYCTDVNFYKTTFPPLVNPVSDIFSRWEETRKETLIATQFELTNYFYRNSTDKPWKLGLGNTFNIIENIRRSPALRVLYDTFIAPKKPVAETTSGVGNLTTTQIPTDNVPTIFESSSTKSGNGSVTISGCSNALVFAIIVTLTYIFKIL